MNTNYTHETWMACKHKRSQTELKMQNAQKNVKTYDNTWRLQFIEATQNPDQQVFKEQTTFMKSIWQLIWESSFHLFPGFRHWRLKCTPYTYKCCCSNHSMIPETMWLHAGLSTSTRAWKNRSCSQAAHEHIYRNQNWFIKKLNGLEHIPNHINEYSCARIWTHCLRPLAKRLRLLYQKLAALSHCLLPLAKRLQELHLTGDALASGYIWII